MLTAEEIGREYGDAVWRVDVEGCGSAGSGTAFAISRDLFVTNAHVTSNDMEPTLTARDGTTRSGRVIGYRDWPDVAVIQVTEPVDSWLKWAPTEELNEGQRLTAISYPAPLLSFTVSPGNLLSFKVEDGERIALASDEITDYGSSGAPILTDIGLVAGVVTEFADGDGRQIVGLSYTHAFLQPHIDEMIDDPSPAKADCEALEVPTLPEGWAGEGSGSRPGVDGYGSDADLDHFWDACEAGDFAACDDLFRYSPSGSAYEEFGDTCGNRNEPAGWCVDVHASGSSGSARSPGPVDGYGSDADLDRLWDACEDGDFAACDELYRDSPSGSAYEEFGDTCGNRNEPAGYCVDVHSS